MTVLIPLLVTVIILGLIVWIINLIPLAQPFKGITMAVVAVIAIVYLFSHFL